MEHSILYDSLLSVIKSNTKNILILGRAGSGKTMMVKKIVELYGDENILLMAPSGIAAQNINGRTIQSVFGIKSCIYEWNEHRKIHANNRALIEKASIILIDEISMVRADTLDYVDNALRYITGNYMPYGGKRCIFIGDLFQLEQVVTDRDANELQYLYPLYYNNYAFYVSNVLKRDNYFYNTFEIFQLEHNFRQEHDEIFKSILDEMRTGKINQVLLNTLNTRYLENISYEDDAYMYLTNTNDMADVINNQFLKNLPGCEYKTEPLILDEYGCADRLDFNSKMRKPLILKRGMKVMFIKNDYSNEKPRWCNGTIGIVEDIKTRRPDVESVTVRIGDECHEVRRETQIEYDKFGDSIVTKGRVTNIPLQPAYAITIDKSQGLTLDKVVLVLGKMTRPNRTYVGLSRLKSLNDLSLKRPIWRSDIKTSPAMLTFYKSIEEKIISVKYHKPEIMAA